MAFNRERALTAAAKFAAKGQHDRAAKEYVTVVEADPSDIRSWLLLAEALVNAGDKPGAIERYLHVGQHYTQPSEGNPTGEAQKAIAVYRKVLGLDPNRLDIQTRIAGLYRDLGRTADAVSAYEFVAQAYFQAGQIAEGLEGFRMVAELEPAAVGKRLRLAELYSREGMVPQAVEHFRLAAERLLADRRTDDYIRVAERLIYHKEDDLPVLRSLAQIYLKQGENRRALVKLNALLRAAPADAEGLELLGETFVAIGKVDKAISVVMELAREQRKGGRKSKETAARVLRKALGWNPDNAEDIKKIAGEIEAEIAALPPDPKDGKEARDEDIHLDVDVVEDEAAASSSDLDVDVDIEEDERKVEEVPSRPFVPVGANVAPSVVEEGEDSVGDVEKILLEARVYVKYKMFEHALGHLDAVFVRDASHVAALDLQAQILVELGRSAEAADSYVRLAQLASARDAKQARDYVERAQALVPDHTKAEMVLAALESGATISAEATPLVRGLQGNLRGDPETEPSRVFDPGESSSRNPVEPSQPGVRTDTSGQVASDSKTASEVSGASKPGASETSGARPLARNEGSGARRLPTEPPSDSSSARPLARGEGSASRKLPTEVLTESSDARKLPTETSGANQPPTGPTETSGANKPPTGPTETSGANKPPTGPTETSGANKPPTDPTETSGASKPPTGPTETSGANQPPTGPTETSGANKPPTGPTETSGASQPPTGPTETSGASKPPTGPTGPTETSGASQPPTGPTETSGASQPPTGPTETSGANKPPAGPTETSGASKLPTDSTEGSVARRLPTEKTPLPISPLLTKFGEKTPLPKSPLPSRFSEKTPLPTFKPPPSDAIARAAGETDDGEAKPAISRRASAEQNADGEPKASRPPDADSESKPTKPSFRPPLRGERRSEPGAEGDRPTEPASEGKPIAASERPAEPASEEKPIEPRSRVTPTRPVRKPVGSTFKPPTRPTQLLPSPEVEELDAGVIEELDVEEVAELEEAPRPPPPKKAPPPGRSKPPTRPPPTLRTGSADQPPKTAPPASKASAESDSKAKPESPAEQQDLKAVVTAGPKKRPVPADSKTRADDSSAQTSQAKAAEDPAQPSGDGTARTDEEPAKAVSEDRRSGAVPGDEGREVQPAGAAPLLTDDASRPLEQAAASRAGTESPARPADAALTPQTVLDTAVRPPDEASATTPTREPTPRAEDAAASEPSRSPSEATSAEGPAPPKDPGERVAANAAPPATPASADLSVEPADAASGRVADAALGAPVPEDSSTRRNQPAIRPAAATRSDAAQPDARETAEPSLAAPASTLADEPAARPLEPPGKPGASQLAPPAGAASARSKPGKPAVRADDSATLAVDALTTELSAPASTDQPDITDELEELRFFISGRFEDDAQFAYLDLQRRFPGHPALAEFADRFATGAKLESAAAPVTIDDRPVSSPTSSARKAVPATVLRLEDEDEDTFLASIFDEPATIPTPGKAVVPRRAVATMDEGADAQTFFDLGTAYREMGLIDDALNQFELAAKDARWTSRARVMQASLRAQRNEHDLAVADLQAAIASATEQDEQSEARYELGVLYQSLGDHPRAIAALEAVTPGYRDRDERLRTLGAGN